MAFRRCGSWLLLLLSVSLVPGCREQAPGVGQAASSPLQAAAQVALDVETTAPKREDLLRRITLPGNFEAYEQATLYAKVSGYLEWIGVDIGDRVRKNQIIARLSIPEMENEREVTLARLSSAQARLESARAELERSEAEYQLKKLTFGRVSSIREEDPDVMPQQNVDQAKKESDVAASNVRLNHSRIDLASSQIAELKAKFNRLMTLMAYAEIKAPFEGTIATRFVDPGTLIQEGTSSSEALAIVTVVRTDPIRLFVDVPEKETPYLDRGDPVGVSCDALAGRRFEGRVTRYTGILDPSSRTLRTEIDLENRKGLFRPGMFARVELVLESVSDALVVPSDAVRNVGDGDFVFVVSGGRVERVEVKKGMDDLIRAEIRSGLDGTEQVVVASSGPITNGSPVRASEWTWPTK